jgi:hypothetical protein
MAQNRTRVGNISVDNPYYLYKADSYGESGMLDAAADSVTVILCDILP